MTASVVLHSLSFAVTSGTIIEKSVFATTAAAFERSSSSTVWPRPFGYCSVTITGMLSSLAARTIRCAPVTTVAKR